MAALSDGAILSQSPNGCSAGLEQGGLKLQSGNELYNSDERLEKQHSFAPLAISDAAAAAADKLPVIDNIHLWGYKAFGTLFRHVAKLSHWNPSKEKCWQLMLPSF
jgi:hypothetical protein